jgi:hypothetical protein
LKKAGRIKSLSTPAALALSPAMIEQNRLRLGAVDFTAAGKALEEAIAREGFSRETFVPGFQLLDQLEAVARGTQPIPDWRKALPPASSWVVSGRPLLCPRPASHGRLRNHEPAGRNPGAKGNAATRAPGSGPCRSRCRAGVSPSPT